MATRKTTKGGPVATDTAIPMKIEWKRIPASRRRHWRICRFCSSSGERTLFGFCGSTSSGLKASVAGSSSLRSSSRSELSSSFSSRHTFVAACPLGSGVETGRGETPATNPSEASRSSSAMFCGR